MRMASCWSASPSDSPAAAFPNAPSTNGHVRACMRGFGGWRLPVDSHLAGAPACDCRYLRGSRPPEGPRPETPWPPRRLTRRGVARGPERGRPPRLRRCATPRSGPARPPNVRDRSRALQAGGRGSATVDGAASVSRYASKATGDGTGRARGGTTAGKRDDHGFRLLPQKRAARHLPCDIMAPISTRTRCVPRC